MACDHKFVGTNHCLKCGWEPPIPARKLTEENAGLRARVRELERETAAWRALAEFPIVEYPRRRPEGDFMCHAASMPPEFSGPNVDRVFVSATGATPQEAIVGLAIKLGLLEPEAKGDTDV